MSSTGTNEATFPTLKGETVKKHEARRYIEEAEVPLDKSLVKKIMHEVYQEACEII